MLSPTPPTLPQFVLNRLGIGILLAAAIALGALLSGCADTGGDNAAAIDAPRSQPAAYTQAHVQAAIDRYEAEGLDATLDYYNSDESVDGQWYVFIVDEAGEFIAHAVNPALLDVHASEVTGADDYPLGQIIFDSADEDGAWVEYLFAEPSGAIGLKHSWVIEHDGLIFGSGWYEGPRPKYDQPAYTQEYVRLAINLYEASGRDVLVDYYNDPVSVVGQWYMFIVDESGRLIAQGANQDLVGVPVVDVVGANGYPSGRIVADDADEDGEWSQYLFFNPTTGRSQVKHSWLIKHDGLIFGSGWYEDGPRKSDQPAYTQALVQQAMNLYDSSGLDATLAYYNDPVNVDGPWYAFVINPETGKSIGHFRPEIRERDPSERVDSTGYFYGDDLLGAPEEGRWVRYVFRDPATGDERVKHTWAVLHDGYIFASGWYE